jgi:hypothetical protein
MQQDTNLQLLATCMLLKDFLSGSASSEAARAFAREAQDDIFTTVLREEWDALGCCCSRGGDGCKTASLTET